MKTMVSRALKFVEKENCLYVLNQQKLPQQEEWLICETPNDMVNIIKELKTRGAPLIGVAACLSLAHYALKGASHREILEAEKKLRHSRPTAVNLMNSLDRMLNTYDPSDISTLVKTAETIFDEDIQLCEQMSSHGAELIKSGENILTHCNTGGLATVGCGTAFGVIQKAFHQNKNIHVYVDETRPLLQGGRLTTWELDQEKIPYTLICDNMAAHLMAEKKIDRIFVGADRIATNGDFANKIGTYSLAVNAHFHKVPFYVVAPHTTIDLNCAMGKNIPIEQRDSKEVQGVCGSFGQVVWSPKECQTYNPSFDVTPAHLVTGWVFNKGLFDLQQINDGVLQNIPSQNH